MPNKKTKENNNAVTDTETLEVSVPDFTEESDSANMQAEEKIFTEEKTGVFIKLVNGGSFTYGGRVFRKNVPVPVEEKTAEKLMKTGFFEEA